MANTRRSLVFFWSPALLVLGLAFWLRWENAQHRQFHADEGVQAYQAWRLIETGDYRYDPQEHHGPLLYYVTDWLSPLLEDETGALSDLSVRSVPIGFSLVTLAIGLVLYRKEGRATALLWAAVVATLPLCVIYGAYYVQEALFGCFTLGFTLFVFRYLEFPKLSSAIGAGCFIALMEVTKETALIHAFAVLVAVFVLLLRDRKSRIPLSRRLFVDLLVVVGCVALLHVVFYSSLFENSQGIWDGVRSYRHYFDRAGGQGHEKGIAYYASLFLPQTLEGVQWGESAFVILVLATLFYGVWGKLSRLGRYLGIVALVHFIVYSAIPYKTPWLIYSFLILVAYPVSEVVVEMCRRIYAWRGGTRLSAQLALALFLGWWAVSIFQNVRLAIFRYASDARNPYLYVHTTPRYAGLLDRLETIEADVPIEVYSPDGAWPLPWHLRGRENVGFWPELHVAESDRVLIVDTRLLAEENPLASNEGVWELHGLRPNVLLALRVPSEIAESWIQR